MIYLIYADNFFDLELKNYKFIYEFKEKLGFSGIYYLLEII